MALTFLFAATLLAAGKILQKAAISYILVLMISFTQEEKIPLLTIWRDFTGCLGDVDASILSCDTNGILAGVRLVIVGIAPSLVNSRCRLRLGSCR